MSRSLASGGGIPRRMSMTDQMAPRPVWGTTSKTVQEAPAWTFRLAEPLEELEVSGTDERSAFDEIQEELQDLWQNSKMNKYYDPISKLPRLGPPPKDPRGSGAPRCIAVKSIPRHHRIMNHWNSMPSLRRQLPADALDHIQRKHGSPPGQESMAQAAQRRGHLKFSQSTALFQNSGVGEIIKADKGISVNWEEETINVGLDWTPAPASKERSKHHVPCGCCERDRPKPWLEKRTVGAAALALVSEAMDRPAGSVPLQEPEVCGTCGGTPNASAVGGFSTSP